MKSTNGKFKIFLLLLFICLAEPIHTLEKTRSILHLHKLKKRGNTKIKNSGKRNSSRFKFNHHLNLTSKFRRAMKNTTKDPVTITVFAVIAIIKITSSVLDYYIQKNYQLTLNEMKEEFKINRNNAEILRKNQMSTCSSMQLLLRLVKHLYLVSKFKIFYSEAYLKKQSENGDTKISRMMEKISNVNEEIKDIYPKILNNMLDNVKVICEESELGDDLIIRNQKLAQKIFSLESKLDDQKNESGILATIFECLLSDMAENKSDLVGLQFQFPESETDNEKTLLSFEKKWTNYGSLINTAKSFYDLSKDIKEFYNSDDKDTAQWLGMISKILNFISSVSSSTGNFADPLTGVILSGASCILTLISKILDFVASIIQYSKEKNLKLKKQKKKKVWSHVKNILFQIGKCIASPVVEAIESFVNLVIKVYALIESKRALEKEIKDKAFYKKKGEIEIEINRKFETYYQCEMRHFTVQLFYEVFRDALLLDQEIGIEDGKTEKVWRQLVGSVETTETLKKNIEELCSLNIQFCSRTFSEVKLKEIGFSDAEITLWKSKAINGPYSDIVVADSNEKVNSFIQLGYEPIFAYEYKSELDSTNYTILGCRLCSSKYAIRYIELYESHSQARKAFFKNTRNIGTCDISNPNNRSIPICKKLFNDPDVPKEKNSDYCDTKFKTIRFNPLDENGVIGYEKVKYKDEFTSVASSFLLTNFKGLHANLSTSSSFELRKFYSVWSKTKARYFDCSNYKNHFEKNQENIFASRFCNNSCTNSLYSTPIPKNGYLYVDESKFPGSLYNLQKSASNVDCNGALIVRNREIPQYLSFGLKSSHQKSKEIKSSTEENIGYKNQKEPGILMTFGCVYKIDLNEEIKLRDDHYNWILETNGEPLKINNTEQKELKIQFTKFYEGPLAQSFNIIEDINKKNKVLKDVKLSVYSMKPFSEENEKQSVTQQDYQKSSQELCSEICDDKKNICSYHVKKPKVINTNLGNEIFEVSFVKLQYHEKYKYYYSNIKFQNPAQNLCLKASRKEKEMIATFLIMAVECSDEYYVKLRDIQPDVKFIVIVENNMEFMNDNRIDGYEMIITPNFNQPEIFMKSEFYFRVLVKYKPSRGFVPFNDYLNSTAFHYSSTCMKNLIKSSYLKIFWPEEYRKNFDLVSGHIAGFTPLKLKNAHLNVFEESKIQNFINLEYDNCKEYNLFFPKIFIRRKDSKVGYKLFKKIINEDDRLIEKYVPSGPGIKSIYWIQISNTESLFNDEKLLDIAWKYRYVPIHKITSKDGKIMMRVWVTYNFEIYNDRKSLCDRCMNEKIK